MAKAQTVRTVRLHLKNRGRAAERPLVFQETFFSVDFTFEKGGETVC